MFRHNLLRKLTSSVVFPTAEFYAPLCNWLTTENVIFEWSCKNTTNKILNRHILTNVHLFNFPFHSLWRLHFFGKYICTKAFKHTYSIIYNAYTMQIDFPYMVKKLSAILKLSYPPKTEVVLACLHYRRTIQPINDKLTWLSHA